MRQTSVSVVIPNFNGEHLLKLYLPSLFKALQSTLVSAYEVIVVDDCSSDNSVAFLQQLYPSIKIVTTTINSGFSIAANIGIHSASMENILLLNTDMQVSNNLFDILIPLLLDSSDVFGVTCAIRDPQKKVIIEGLKRPKYTSCKINYYDDLSESLCGQTMYLCGGIALINRIKLLSIGGFNEIFSPFYFEDMDLGLRAQENGWKCLYTTLTSVLHCHAATIGANFSQEQIRSVFIRNRVLVAWRHLPHSHRLLILINAMYHSLKEIITHSAYHPYRDALKRLRFL